MKRTVLTLAIVLGLCPVLATGQDRTPDQKQQDRTEVRAERMTERMARTYDLDEKQKAKLLKANKAYVETMNEVAPLPPRQPRRAPRHHARRHHRHDCCACCCTCHAHQRPACDYRREQPERPPLTDEQRAELEKQRKERREKADQARTEYDKQLKKIMTDEQYQDYRDRQEQRRKQWNQAPRQRNADECPAAERQANS